jgi:ATP synthase subunit 6
MGSFGGYRYNFYKLKTHIVPKGSPIALASVLSNIEAVRISIRPITLGVRLIANLTTGHLLLGLIANMNRVRLTARFLVQVVFIALEIGVAIIQGYVFALLLGLYSSEV